MMTFTPFVAEIIKHPGMDVSYIRIPFDLRKETGKGRLRVHVTIDGVPYDGSIVNLGEKNPLRKHSLQRNREC